MTSLQDSIDDLLASGRARDAFNLLNQRAAADAADALLLLGFWRVSGVYIPRDLPIARDLFGRAAALGNIEAALLHSYFLAHGAGAKPDWPGALARMNALAPTFPPAAKQLDLLRAMDLDGDGTPSSITSARILSATPAVSMISGFLSLDEAAYVREAVHASMRPSMIVDPRTGALVNHPIRRSDEATFGVFDEDLVIGAINRRIAAASGTAIEQGEPLTVLRYRPGGEYRAHSDALPGTDNQRVATVILYLDADYDGGETRFVETGLTVRGRIGDALLFRNVTADGRPDPLSRHAGLPIKRGIKSIATRWIRARTCTYSAPRPVLG